MPTLCRDCAEPLAAPPASARCPACASPRLLDHAELDTLTLAHIDCDAFYAAVEKRDNPELRDRPVIVGGLRRGVVMACCYMARIRGVRSAMPMFQARKLCPDAVVIRPALKKYRAVGRQVRTLMEEVTPLVEPLSVDEAFLDLSGTESLHGGNAARTLARLVKRIEDEVGVTASVGLSYNKFLAKVASDLDKPRGFAVIGRAEAQAFLEGRPVGLLWGVGKVMNRRLADDGIATIGQLGSFDEAELVRRYGAIGARLARFARGEDSRRVDPNSPAKSISSETTFDADIAEVDALKAALWPLCEEVAERLRAAALGAGAVTLKLKTARFRLLTRSRTLDSPTQLAEVLYRTGAALVEREARGTPFRLIGIGAGTLVPEDDADPPDLVDGDKERWARLEKAMDEVRGRFGKPAIAKGRGWRGG
ncbi:MAG: DNA polymerase IV [Rhodospirillales bacterium]|jgi:DNA polymerase-4|nr:DNA polymerase IV [Rhodospirillales bacterium]MDP6772805.1 DNA polymerase IV [Rhodospirillales bacterium]